LDDVQCVGNEESIANCSHGGWGNHNCLHEEDVSVTCGWSPAQSGWLAVITCSLQVVVERYGDLDFSCENGHGGTFESFQNLLLHVENFSLNFTPPPCCHSEAMLLVRARLVHVNQLSTRHQVLESESKSYGFHRE